MFRSRGEFSNELTRVASSVSSAVEDIRDVAAQRELPFGALAETFDFADRLPQQVAASADEMWQNGEVIGEQPDFEQVGSLVTMLSELERGLAELRDALLSSLDRSGFYWWLKRRQAELGCDNLVIIVKSGTSVDFAVDTIGKLRSHFERLDRQQILDLGPGKLGEIKNVRLLTVPKFDGADPIWHPLTLGHELAHLRYDAGWVTEWLAAQKLPKLRDSAAKTAVHQARNIVANTAHRSDWFSQLASWLVETACDSAMSFYYRDEGVVALEHLTSIAGRQASSASHPKPRLRYAVQRAGSHSDMAAFREDDPGMLNRQQTINAYCALSVALRDAVHQDLLVRVGEDFEGISDATFASAQTALREETPGSLYAPASQNWPLEAVRNSSSAIESGLIRSLWSSIQFYSSRVEVADGQTHTFAAEMGLPAYDGRREHIYRSIESLQFCHRFEEQRVVHAPEHEHVIPNVLWVGRDGVSTEPNADMAGCVSSHDVRLGRHFITFLRRRISTLSALDIGTTMARTQEEVEVDWGDVFVLHPGEMVLGVTFESFIVANDATAQVLSRSSIGRLGLLSATAVHVQPGFRGCLTLELVNLSSVPLQLCPGQRIAQVVAQESHGRDEPYFGKYQGAGWKPQHSAAGEDWDSTVLSNIRRIDDQRFR